MPRSRTLLWRHANPALTYQVGGSGLVNGDTLSGALATSATAASDAGVYGITQGTLAASSNYARLRQPERASWRPPVAALR